MSSTTCSRIDVVTDLHHVIEMVTAIYAKPPFLMTKMLRLGERLGHVAGVS
jgi:hypothetical protein